MKRSRHSTWIFAAALLLLAGCQTRTRTPDDTALAPSDWIVLIIYLVAMLGIGVFYFLRNKSEKDFFLGGGKMNPVALGLSLFATLTSSLSYLGYPGETIKYGPVMLSGALSFPLIYFIVGWLLIPRLKKLNVTSAYEILEMKLGVSVRLLATFFFLAMRLLWMATIIHASIDVVVINLFNIDPSWKLLLGAVLMGVTIIYTSMGGLKGVVVTDVVQSIVLLGGALLVLLYVSWDQGSLISWIPAEWPEQWSSVNFSVDPRDRSAIGSAILMTLIWYVASSGADQMSIQRFLASESVGAARKTFGVSLLASFISMLLLTMVGFALMVYFSSNPSYLPDGVTLQENTDKLFPKFIVVGLPDGLTGLLIAAILAAAMSSLSSGINSTASVISIDIIKRFRSHSKKTINDLKLAKTLSMLTGIVTLGLSLAIPYVKGNLVDLSIKVVNLFVSPLFVLFFMALFVPFATARGTFIGGITGTAIAIAVAFFGFLGIEVFFITIVSLFTGIATGMVFSYLDHRFLGNSQTAEKLRNIRLRSASSGQGGTTGE